MWAAGQSPTRPKNTKMARPSLAMSAGARRPMRSPALEPGIVLEQHLGLLCFEFGAVRGLNILILG